MEYVSLDQSDANDLNSNIGSLNNITKLPDIELSKAALNFENLKCHIKNHARKGKKRISKFRRDLYKKQANCQNRASLIVHMVTNSPKDPKNLIFISLILSGVGFLFPYNCLINAADYFQLKFCNNHLIYSISVAYVLSSVCTVALNNTLVQSVHFIKRIVFGYILTILVLLVLTITIIWLQILSKESSYYWIITATCITAIGCAVQQSSFYGYSSLLPRRYTQALMIGESLSGVLASAFRISTYIILTEKPTIYFFLCIGQMVLCLIVFQMSVRSGFVQHHLQRHQLNVMTNNCSSFIKSSHSLSYQINTPNSSSSNNNISNMVAINHDWASKTVSMEMINPAFAIEEENLPQDEPPDLESSDEEEIEEVFDNEFESSDIDQSESAFSDARKNSTNSKTSICNNRTNSQPNFSNKTAISTFREGIKFRLEICKSIWPFMVSMFLAYFVTLSVFPGVLTDITSKHWKSSFPLLAMLVFNVSDFAGKISTSIIRNSSGWCLFISSILRISFIPLMIFCVIPTSGPFITGDFWVLLLTSLLGLTNGYIGCLPMLQASQVVKDNQKEVSGNLMTTAYSLGLSVGVLSALEIKNLIIIPRNLVNNSMESAVNYTSKFC